MIRRRCSGFDVGTSIFIRHPYRSVLGGDVNGDGIIVRPADFRWFLVGSLASILPLPRVVRSQSFATIRHEFLNE